MNGFAMKTAGRVTGINPALWRRNEAESDVYSFCHGDTLVNVAKSGQICRIINPMPCKTAKFSLSEAEEKAAEYLADFGYENISVLRREKSEFTASFLFYPIVNRVMLMTCPIAVDICLSSGALTFMDSYGYIRNYRNDIYAPDDSESFCCLEEIKGKEKLCIYSECRYNNYIYYVYTDPETRKIILTENA